VQSTLPSTRAGAIRAGWTGAKQSSSRSRFSEEAIEERALRFAFDGALFPTLAALSSRDIPKDLFDVSAAAGV
jgi:hypothetical protein